jgi:hypothetical protein
MNDSPLLVTALPSVLVSLAIYVWTALSLSAIFRKAGEDGWQAWVPFLNTAVLLRLGGFTAWFVLLALVPVLGWFALYAIVVVSCHRIGRAFGFGPGMTFLAALVFPVWSSVLGWGAARWIGSDTTAVAGPLRRGIPADLDERIATPYASRLPASSVFGAHGAAGGPEVPPRPPAPTGGFPSVVPATSPPGVESAPAVPVPPTAAAFRSTMRETDDGARVPGFESRAPFTQTFPVQGRNVTQAPTPPAAPIRAVPGVAEDSTGDGAGVAPLPAGTPPPPPAPTPAASDPWAPPVVSAAGPRALRLPVPDGSEPHYETSAEVSAVAGAPTLGSPRSARASVSAQHAAPEIPDDDAFDETFVAVRRRTAWTLVPPLGAPVPLTSDTVILGRRPTPDQAFPEAQLVPISDETRTVSKTHARLELDGEGWCVVDLDSTNGVILIGADGAEVDAAPGVAERLSARFLLGDAELQVRREGE